MPIKGLTDRGMPTFPQIGSIRKGARKTQKNRPGADLTYFRYVPLEGEEQAAELFAQVYGDEPREINVFLPFDEIERNFETWMERHTAGALHCRGDGESAVLWRDEKGTMHHEPKKCPSPYCEGCKETGRLKIIIPELRRLAYVVVHTTSKWDIVELTANLEAIRRLTGNGLKGIPLVLKRRPRSISTPVGKKTDRVRREKWLLSLEADPRWVQAQIAAMELAALPAGDYTRIGLPAKTGIAEAEIIDVAPSPVPTSPPASLAAAVIAAGLTENVHSFNGTLKKLTDLDVTSKPAVLARFTAYHKARKDGLDSDTAAAIANARCWPLKDGRTLGEVPSTEYNSMLDQIAAVEQKRDGKLSPRLTKTRKHLLTLLAQETADNNVPQFTQEELMEQWRTLVNEARERGIEFEPANGDSAEALAEAIDKLVPLLAQEQLL